jgi:flagellar biosynthetic protein FlhB
MSGQEDDTDKSFEATATKLLQARKKGEIAKSNDLLTAAGYAGLLCAVTLTGAWTVDQIGTSMMILLEQATALAPVFLSGMGTAPAGGLAKNIGLGLLPLFALPAVFVVLAVFAQNAWVFAPTKLKPKLSRISLISNAKNKFGRSGLFEFAKSFTKLCVYSVLLGFFVNANMSEMIAGIQGEPGLNLSLLAQLCVTFLLIVVLISAVIGGIDAFWQHFEHLRKNRMSRKEIMDETKNDEGDPHLKQERRQRALSASQNQMLRDVPDADVVIVNPTHYAIALKWTRKPGEAPICIAKGVDEIAASIRRVAEDANVPIHSDPPTARSLFASTDVGDQIVPEHYRAVAAAIRFAEKMRNKAGASQ